MSNIGEGIRPTRSMSHNQQRQHVVYDHPKTARREVAIMRLLRSGPLYTFEISATLGDTYVSESLTALKKIGLIGKYRRWYLMEIEEQ